MATVGNRFESLLINAKNPLEKSKKKERKRQEDSSAKYAKKAAAAKQKAEAAAAAAAAAAAEAKKKAESVRNPVIITDLTSVTNNKPNTIPPKKASTVIVKDVTEAARPNQDLSLDGISFTKDPKNRPLGRYQKVVIVDRGRIYDRHGPPRSDRQQEKRHGHGAYNWGEQLDNTAETADIKDTSIKGDVLVQPKEECGPPPITLDQYRKLVQEKKIDPLSWAQEPSKSETYVQESDSINEYDYNRMYSLPRARGGGRYTPRGSGPSRGKDVPQRNAQAPTYQEKKGPVTVIDVKVFDNNDFPEL